MFFVQTTCVGQFPNQLVGPFDTYDDALNWADDALHYVALDHRGRIQIHDVCPPDIASQWDSFGQNLA